MAIEAIISLAEKGGSSLVSIRRYILEHNLETQSKQPASFNNLTLKALNTLAADGKVDREKHTYKLSFNFIKSLNKKGIQMNDDGTTSKIDKDSEFSGTAAEHNKIIRQLISDRRIIRDAHLFKHLDTLLPFFDPDVSISFAILLLCSYLLTPYYDVITHSMYMHRIIFLVNMFQ
jgi:hypothetical protein